MRHDGDPAASRGAVPDCRRGIHRRAGFRLFRRGVSHQKTTSLAEHRASSEHEVEQRLARPPRARHVRDTHVHAETHARRDAAADVFSFFSFFIFIFFVGTGSWSLRRFRHHPVPRSRGHVDGVPRCKCERLSQAFVQNITGFASVARRVAKTSALVHIAVAAARPGRDVPGFRTVQLHGNVVVGVVVPGSLHAALRARVHADVHVVREPKTRGGGRPRSAVGGGVFAFLRVVFFSLRSVADFFRVVAFVLRELGGVVRHTQHGVAQRVRARRVAERQAQRVPHRRFGAVEHLRDVVVVVDVVRLVPAIARDEFFDVAVPEPFSQRTERVRWHAPGNRGVPPDVAKEIRRVLCAARAHRGRVGEQVVDVRVRVVILQRPGGGRLGIVGAIRSGIAGHGRGARAFPRFGSRLGGVHARNPWIARAPTRNDR